MASSSWNTDLSVGEEPSFFKYWCTDFIEKEMFFGGFLLIKLDVNYENVANFIFIWNTFYYQIKISKYKGFLWLFYAAC